MLAKEVNEIRKRYNIDDCSTIGDIVGCYVKADQQILETFKKSIWSLPEEEQFKYLDIFKKGFTGKVGKNICTTAFPTAAEGTGTMHEGLMTLWKTKLENDEINNAFFQKIIESYPVTENYVILLINNVYDVPKRGSDGHKNTEASDEVYDYISCYICPVKLEAPGLFFNENDGHFMKKDRRWCVDLPVYSFIFPSFEDRSGDIHNITIFTKKTDGMFKGLTEALIGTQPAMAADEQKYVFSSLVQEVVRDAASPLAIVKDIHENIAFRIESNEDKAPLELTAEDIKRIAEDSGLDQASSENLYQAYKSKIGDSLPAENIVDKNRLKLKSPDIEVKINTEKAKKLGTTIIEKEKFLLIPIDSESEVEVNGIPLS